MAIAPTTSKTTLEQKLQERFKEIANGKSSLSYMQFVEVTGCRSELFAKGLFGTMDTDDSGDISCEECVETIYVLQSRETDRRKRFLFNLFDIDRNDVITKSELSAVLSASLEEAGVALAKHEREELLDSLVDLFDMEEFDAMTFEEFSERLDVYPDLLDGFSLEGLAIFDSGEQETHPKTWWSKTVLFIVNHPQDIMTYALLTVTLIGCFFWRFQRYMWNCDADGGYDLTSAAEAESDRLRCQDARKRVLMGWSLPIAKGAAQAMKAVFTLILFPVSRSFMTFLRMTCLKYFVNFDKSIDFHKIIGTIGFVLAWIHTLCHVCDIKRWADPNRRNLYFNAFPKHKAQPSIGDLMKEQVVLTGIILIAVYTIAALFALDYPRKLSIFDPKRRPVEETTFTKTCNAIGRFLNNFNNFWYTHHLFVVFYVCLLLHPRPALPHEKYEWAVSDTWVWLVIPLTLYVYERCSRAVMSTVKATDVISADIHAGNVVELKITRPSRVFFHTAGQYVFLNCPQISRFEWHPFTLTSSPGDSYWGVHIRVNGDWTQALYDAVKTHWDLGDDLESVPASRKPSQVALARRRTTSVLIKSVSGIEAEVETGHFPFSIKVDGPFGSPSQNFKAYKVVLLIGAGIGVTPFASVLNDLLETMKAHKCPNCDTVNLPRSFRIQKVYFYWTVRSREEMTWFSHVLEAISLQDSIGFIDINIHVTTLRRYRICYRSDGNFVATSRSNDIRMMLLRLAQLHDKERRGLDPLAGYRTRAITHFGRPNWQEVFQRIKNENKLQTRHCGVFYCGPNSLQKILKEQARKSSSKEMIFDISSETFG